MINDITYMCHIVNFTNFYSKASLLENTLTEILINPVKWSFRIPEKWRTTHGEYKIHSFISTLREPVARGSMDNPNNLV